MRPDGSPIWVVCVSGTFSCSHFTIAATWTSLFTCSLISSRPIITTSSPIAMPSGGEAPADGLAGTQRHHGLIAECVRRGHFPCTALERHLRRVARQSVEVRAVMAREGLQAVERVRRLERLGVELERRVRGIDAG